MQQFRWFWYVIRKHKYKNLYITKTKKRKQLFDELEIKLYTKPYQHLYTIHKSDECHPEWINYIEKNDDPDEDDDDDDDDELFLWYGWPTKGV